MDRRGLLAGASIAFTTALGGCLGEFRTTGRVGSDDKSDGDSANNDSETSTAQDAEKSDSRPPDLDEPDAPDEISRPGIRRGEATTEVYGRETIENDDVEYLDNGTVEIVTLYSGDEPVQTEIISFEEWGEFSCPSTAGDVLLDHLETRFDDLQAILIGQGSWIKEYDGTAITVRHVTQYDREGEKIEEPVMGFDQLVAETPRTVVATVELADREHSCALPVYVQTYDSQQD